jgi:predicted kinase
MSTPKLILLNGFAGAGKTTIARKYIENHPLALVIEGDEIIVNIGQWLENEEEARKLVFELVKAMVRTYLQSGNDVVLPYLVTNARHADEFETLAAECSADFYEILLHSDRPEAIARLLKRGTWGEAGVSPLTNQDLPAIEELMSRMEAEIEKRPNNTKITIKEDDPDDTYRLLMNHIAK